MGVDFLHSATALRPADIELLLGHYATAGPLMERLFGTIPFTWATAPNGPAGEAFYHGPLSDATVPKAPYVDVPTSTGTHRYAALSAARISGLVQFGAVEIHSWAPTVADPTRAAFGRILVATTPATRVALPDALAAMRAVLADDNLQCALVFDGKGGAALWIPFADAPPYDELREILAERCAGAVARFPKLLTIAPNVTGGPRAHLHVGTNAVGRFSALPYSARVEPGYPLALPVPWEHVASYAGGVDAGELPAWLDAHGEVFGAAVTAIGTQNFADLLPDQEPNARVHAVAQPVPMPAQKTHGPIVAAAIAVLQDGRSHDAASIRALALAAGGLDAAVTDKYVYTSLIEYIARANGNGRKPAIVQNADRSFRMNEPPDDWPALPETAAAPLAPQTQVLIDRLEATAHGSDTHAFEQAVCDAFSALGLEATHLGGQKAPDGYADALLGPLGYRVMIECKSANEGINDPNVFEAAKFRDGYGAQYCALVGRTFSGELALTKELHNHNVSAWAVADLQTLLRIGANALELQPLFASGFAADALDDLLWERRHGRAKRVRLIADAIVRTGRATQAAYHGAPTQAPRLTEDALMILVNQDLAAQSSPATCEREDIQAACAYLANPLVNAIHQAADETIVVL